MARWIRGRLGLGAVVGSGLLAALAGCSPPPPPPPTVVNLTMTASADVNPSTSGQPSPVQLVVYQLGADGGFNGAEFFQLFNKDQATLGPDMVKREPFILAPGASKTTTLMPTDQVKSLGVFAAFQNYQSVPWRGAVAIPPHQTTNVTVAASKAGLTVTAAPAKPGP
jgi:type VI secretion system protein VasD